MATETTIDVRSMPPRERHPRIFSTFDGIAAGDAILLINDHDPKPLFYQFQAERTGQVDWKPQEQGPERWVIRIEDPRPEVHCNHECEPWEREHSVDDEDDN